MDFDYRIYSAAFDLLRPSYTEYVTEVSNPKSAISLETSVFVWTLCEMYQPKVILDMGSGYSSYVFRLWGGLQEIRPFVISVDDNTVWLEKSIEFAKKHNKNVDGFMMHNDKRLNLIKSADFILHDFGYELQRKASLKFVFSMLKHDGLIFLDDIHKHDYAEYVTKFVKGTDLVHLDAEPLTGDQYGRYGVLYSYNTFMLPKL